MIEFIRQVKKNGEPPDEDEKEFILSRYPDTVFLETEWERVMVHIRFTAATVRGVTTTSTIGGTVSKPIYGIDPQIVFAFADRYRTDALELFELINHIHQETS